MTTFQTIHIYGFGPEHPNGKHLGEFSSISMGRTGDRNVTLIGHVGTKPVLTYQAPWWVTPSGAFKFERFEISTAPLSKEQR